MAKKQQTTQAEVFIGPTTDTQAQSVVKFDAESLIKVALHEKVDVSVMERLLAMRKELKAEQARENFYIALSAFQAACPEIKKTKPVKNNKGEVAYSYAPIESIVAQVKELLFRHGFSYTMAQQITERGVKAVCKVIHRDGHEEIFENEFPLGQKTQMMNDSQVVAAATTFANRYVFKNAFGIMTGEDDTDGRIPHITDAEIVSETSAETVFDPATEKIAFGKFSKGTGTLWKDIEVQYLKWLVENGRPDAQAKARATLEYLDKPTPQQLPEDIGHAILVFEDPKQLETWAAEEKQAKWKYHPEFITRYNKKMFELTGKKQPDELPF